MKTYERQLVIDQLTSSESRLLELVDGLTPEQWSFRETPGRWSIAENIEHVILFENFIAEVILKVMEAAAEPDKKELVATKDPLVLSIGHDRHTRFNAREAVRPVGKWPCTTEMIAELRMTRAQTLAFVAGIQGDLREHFFPHVAYGDLDCYQWLLVLGQHGFRHALQIEEIKADPRYPIRDA